MNAQLDTRSDALLDADEAYIARRIVDTCLRENLRDIVRLGQATTPNDMFLRAWPHAYPPLWWRVAHLPGGVVWIPVTQCDYMQDIGAFSHGWIRNMPTRQLARPHTASCRAKALPGTVRSWRRH
jgi:hypothetical protein